MKMFCTMLVLLMAPILLGAQQIRGDFEQWNLSEAGQASLQPQGWQYENNSGAGRDSNAHSGAWAAELWNWYNEVPGRMILGNTPPQPTLDVIGGGGLPISGVPRKLVGSYKFVPGTLMFGEDSAIVVLMLKRYDPYLGKVDTLSYVRMKLGPADAWRTFEVPIPAPANGMMPDSVEIGFASSHSTVCADGYCCHLSLDDLTLETASGVPYLMDRGTLVPAAVAPNPLRSAAAISFDGAPDGHYRISIVDASGRSVRSIDAVGNRVTLDRGDLSPGAYLFIVHGADGATVASGRFVVD